MSISGKGMIKSKDKRYTGINRIRTRRCILKTPEMTVIPSSSVTVAFAMGAKELCVWPPAKSLRFFVRQRNRHQICPRSNLCIRDLQKNRSSLIPLALIAWFGFQMFRTERAFGVPYASFFTILLLIIARLQGFVNTVLLSNVTVDVFF